MAKGTKQSRSVQKGTFREFPYKKLKPNPLNPRGLFDKKQLKILEESIRKNGILVPLTVYKESRTGQHYILDGERRWRCAEKIETDIDDPKRVPIPTNVITEPSKAANLLFMFNIHNLRESWTLMPTALSLEILIKELKETDSKKLAELTQLSEPNVRRCQILLQFPKKYQLLMLDPDPDRRVKANFFIELSPVLDLYEKLPAHCRRKKTRYQLVDHFLELYQNRKIRSVIHFRRILEAYDYLSEDEDRIEDFYAAAETLVAGTKKTIRQLFDPLVAEDKSAQKDEDICKDFLNKIKHMKLRHIIRRSKLRNALRSIRDYTEKLLSELEE